MAVQIAGRSSLTGSIGLRSLEAMFSGREWLVGSVLVGLLHGGSWHGRRDVVALFECEDVWTRPRSTRAVVGLVNTMLGGRRGETHAFLNLQTRPNFSHCTHLG